MLNVSNDFKTAIVANTRRFVPKVEIWFADNRTRGGDILVWADELDAQLFPKENLVNGKTVAVKRWALARDDCYPADDLYPIDEGWEGGWFGTVLSDADGYLDPAVEISFTTAEAMYATHLELYGDEWLGYPVDFVWYRWTGSAWYEVVNVTGNDSPFWIHEMGLYGWLTDQWKVVITRISRANDYPALLEVQPSIYVDVSDDVLSFDVDRVRYYQQRGTLPMGNAAAGELNLVLQNITGKYDRHSPLSICYNNIKPNQKINVELGLVLEDETVEYCPIGVFYSTIWRFDFRNGTARVRALDRSRELIHQVYYSEVLENYTISALVKELLEAAGIPDDEYVVDETSTEVPYAFFGRRTVWEELQELAKGEGGFVYFDEEGNLVFESRSHSLPATASITLDDDDITDVEDVVDESKIANVIQISRTGYVVGTATTIWELKTELTVPASSTITIVAEFDDPALDIDAPVITSGGAHVSVQSYTYSALRGTIVLENTGATDETVSGMYIQGKPLTEVVDIYVERTDPASMYNYGTLIWEVENPYIQSYDQAYSLAHYLLSTYSDPGKEITVSLDGRGLPHLQLGDRVTVHISKPLIWADYWIVGHRLTYDGGLSSKLTLLQAE